MAIANGGRGPQVSAQAAGDGEEPEDKAKRPFVGISIRTVPTAEAEELGIEGGVEVREVVDDSPAAGLLKAGDVVTAIDRERVTSARALIEMVQSATPGDVMQFAVHSEDAPVEITVGERELTLERTITRRATLGPLHDFGLGALHELAEELSRFVSAEVVVEDDDGLLKTYAAVAGTTTAVDVAARTMTLDAEDGSGQVTYSIPHMDSDEAPMIIVDGEPAELADVRVDERTIVATVNGKVELVWQGDMPHLFSGMDRLSPFKQGRAPGSFRVAPFKGFSGGEALEEWLEKLIDAPELRERLEGLADDPELHERLRGLMRPHVGLPLPFLDDESLFDKLRALEGLPFEFDLDCEAEGSEDHPLKFAIRCNGGR